jgi:type IV pilus assembly protein PilO
MAINLSLTKMPWYGQAAAFAVLGLGAAGAFWNWYAQGAQQAIEAQRAQLTSLHAEIDRGRAAERRLPEFRRELASLEGQMSRLRAVLPDERDVADLLRRVQGMATQSSLTILGFTPQPVAKKTIYVEWPIGLKLEGTYHDLGLFLERVSKFPRIINVSNLKVKALDKGTSGATITAEATATTFVLVEGAPDAQAAPAPRGKAPARAGKAAPASPRATASAPASAVGGKATE